MTRILGLFNQASSMGKTTLTLNIGYHLAQRGHKVLVVDMDSHAWLTKHLSVKSRELDTTIYNALITGKTPPIHQDLQGMDLIPANQELSTLDVNLVGEQDRQFRLKKILQPLAKNYDFILLDCPPNLGLASVLCLVAATHVLVPIQTTDKGVEGARDFLATFKNVSDNLNPNLKIVGVVPTLFDGRKGIHKTMLESIKLSFGKAGVTVFPVIGQYTDFEHAWNQALPLAAYNKRHIAVRPLEKIAEQLEAV